MLNQNDISYLRWIAQRLVNKYGEDPKVLLLVDDILSRVISEISIHKTYNNFITQNLPICLKTLQDIISYTNKVPTLIKDNSKQILIDKNQKTFENLDISEILR
jgi:hypothetical protein